MLCLIVSQTFEFATTHRPEFKLKRPIKVKHKHKFIYPSYSTLTYDSVPGWCTILPISKKKIYNH